MPNLRALAHSLVWTKRHLTGSLPAVDIDPLKPFLNKDDICFDIGAHSGVWTVPLSKLVPSGHVYAIEALPYYATVLRSTLRLLGRKNVTVLNRAAMDVKRSVEIVWRDASGQRLTGLTHVRGTEETASDTVTVEGLVLDDLVQGINSRVRFMKLDIEGAELSALRGATQLIDAHQPIIFTELNDEWCRRYGSRAADVFTFFSECNYLGHQRGANGELQAVSIDGYSGDGDVWFAPASLGDAFRQSSVEDPG